MSQSNKIKTKKLIFLLFLITFSMIPHRAFLAHPPASMSDYTAYPPFVQEGAPSLVMLAMGRDHKIYYEAYNDASDLDGDSKLDVGYKHSIDYYGYFDPYKCYTYTSSGQARFVPASNTSTKYCGGTQWSGNFLNWLSMSRMDVIRKVFYGGNRSRDDSSYTYLEGGFIPQDAHSWGKEYSGSDINSLTPFSAPSSGRQHLFCVTSTSDNSPHIVRVLQNRTEKPWQWASIERPVCQNSVDSNNNGYGRFSTSGGVADSAESDLASVISDYTVRVEVCNISPGLESDCKCYDTDGDCDDNDDGIYDSGRFKPTGLLQKYGEGDGSGSKVCSKTYTKACNSNSDCNFATEGICMEKAQMYFGLISGSYENNLQGGVLRKNVWSIQDEININTGFIMTSENNVGSRGNIAYTLNTMRTVGFRYGSGYYSYQATNGGTCGWIINGPIINSQCRDWGNPMAEIMYEATRYFADKGNSPTSSFLYSGTNDAGLQLPKLGTNSKEWIKPYDYYPACSKPFILTFSDINPSYDSNQVPGVDSGFGSFTDSGTPALTNLNASTLANTIGTAEGVAGDRFIGYSGSNSPTYDFICSKKYVSNLSNIRGLCPEEPTKQGSYYSAAVAYYGKTQLYADTGKPNINTYSVVLSSPVPDINVKVGNSSVRIVPTGKSVSGCGPSGSSVYNECFLQGGTWTYDSAGFGLQSSSSGGYCPTNQIVDFYISNDDGDFDTDGNTTEPAIFYNASNELTYAKFRINFEDVEQGADHDMDAIVTYEIRPTSATTVDVTLTSTYAAGCIDQAMGFVISGTTADGTYLVVRDTDSSANDSDTDPPVNTMPTSWTKTFTVGTSTGAFLKDPLWYAAKWGGFKDYDGSGTPNTTQEWDADNDGVPDTYFLVVNPLDLKEQLEKAFSSILEWAASGTAVSILASAGEGEGAIYQAYFYLRKREGTEERNWLGYIHSLFIDDYGNLREDTDGNRTLSLTADYIIRTSYDSSTGTVVDRFSDSNGDGVADSATPVSSGPLEEISPIWDGGKRLWDRDPSTRTIYTTTNGYSFVNFTTGNASTLRPYLRTDTSTDAQNVINYIRGQDISGFRERTLTISGQTKVWKLGDIVYSTPSVVAKPMENYDLKYGDSSYTEFLKKYINRRHVVYVGANDGMLHAFNGGFYDPTNKKFWRSCSNCYDFSQTTKSYSDSGAQLGDELWGFIPRELLPHLNWLTDPNYTHVYYVDLKPKITDVRIFNNDSTHPEGWGTILIGGMRYGGKAIDIESGVITGDTLRSTYFALDITDPEQAPTLLWTFDTTDSGATDLGLTMSYPTVVRVQDEWYAIFGSGPTNFDLNSNLTGFQNGKVFVLRISGGSNGQITSWGLNSNYWKITTGNSNAFMASPITVDVNALTAVSGGGGINYSVDVAYIGENYTQGINKRAIMWRLTTSNNTSVPSWVLSQLYNVNSSNDISKRITAAPTAGMDTRGNFWLYFGTGQFLGVDDRNTTDTGAFYGIKDTCWDGTKSGCPASASYDSNDLYDSSNVVICYGGDVTCPAGSSFDTVLTNVSSTAGWSIYFGNMTQSPDITGYSGSTFNHQGEKVIVKPVVIGGYALFASYIPGSEVCNLEGESNLYAINMETGTASTDYAFSNESVLKDADTTEVVSRIYDSGETRKGMPTTGSVTVNSQGEAQFVDQGGGATLEQTELSIVLPRSKYTGWKAGGMGGL